MAIQISRTCANRSVQKGWMNHKESPSPTAALESVMITGVIDAHEHQDAASVDIPNVFMQMRMKCEPGNEWVTMNVQGVLVDVLVELDPGLCEGQVVCKNGKKTICVIALRATHGVLQSALLFHQQFGKDLEKQQLQVQSMQSVCGKQDSLWQTAHNHISC